MEHDEVYETNSASLTVSFNFCESSKWKEQSVFMNICKVK